MQPAAEVYTGQYSLPASSELEIDVSGTTDTLPRSHDFATAARAQPARPHVAEGAHGDAAIPAAALSGEPAHQPAPLICSKTDLCDRPKGHRGVCKGWRHRLVCKGSGPSTAPASPDTPAGVPALLQDTATADDDAAKPRNIVRLRVGLQKLAEAAAEVLVVPAAALLGAPGERMAEVQAALGGGAREWWAAALHDRQQEALQAQQEGGAAAAAAAAAQQQQQRQPPRKVAQPAASARGVPPGEAMRGLGDGHGAQQQLSSASSGSARGSRLMPPDAPTSPADGEVAADSAGGAPATRPGAAPTAQPSKAPAPKHSAAAAALAVEPGAAPAESVSAVAPAAAPAPAPAAAEQPAPAPAEQSAPAPAEQPALPAPPAPADAPKGALRVRCALHSRCALRSGHQGPCKAKRKEPPAPPPTAPAMAPWLARALGKHADDGADGPAAPGAAGQAGPAFKRRRPSSRGEACPEGQGAAAAGARATPASAAATATVQQPQQQSPPAPPGDCPSQLLPAAPAPSPAAAPAPPALECALALASRLESELARERERSAAAAERASQAEAEAAGYWQALRAREAREAGQRLAAAAAAGSGVRAPAQHPMAWQPPPPPRAVAAGADDPPLDAVAAELGILTDQLLLEAPGAPHGLDSTLLDWDVDGSIFDPGMVPDFAAGELAHGGAPPREVQPAGEQDPGVPRALGVLRRMGTTAARASQLRSSGAGWAVASLARRCPAPMPAAAAQAVASGWRDQVEKLVREAAHEDDPGQLHALLCDVADTPAGPPHGPQQSTDSSSSESSEESSSSDSDRDSSDGARNGQGGRSSAETTAPPLGSSWYETNCRPRGPCKRRLRPPSALDDYAVDWLSAEPGGGAGAGGGSGGSAGRRRSRQAASAQLALPVAPSPPAPHGLSDPGQLSDRERVGKFPRRTAFSHEEKEAFKACLLRHGRNWEALLEVLPGRTLTMIRNFYNNHRSKLGLDSLLRQREAALRS